MSNIEIKDIDEVRTLSNEELPTVRGGFYFGYNPWAFLYRNVFNPRSNPYGFAIQQSTFQTSRMWDAHNANFLAYLRS